MSAMTSQNETRPHDHMTVNNTPSVLVTWILLVHTSIPTAKAWSPINNTLVLPCCRVPILLTTFPRTSAERINCTALLLLLCSHSPNDVPPEPQRNVSIAAVRGAMRPSKPVLPCGTSRLIIATWYSARL